MPRYLRVARLARLARLALALWPLAACGSYSTYRTTRLASTEKTELLFGAQVAGARAPDGAGAPLPELSVSARRGVGERYEVQANGTLLALEQGRTGSLELGGKLRVLSEGRWSLAVGAAAGYRIAESGGAIIEGAFVSAPVIGGIELGRHQLVVSVTGGYQRWYSSGARPVDVPFVGESLGFVWQLTKRWALLPEVGTAYTPTKNMMTDDSRLFHAGLAVIWSR
ncbi:MAG TPA: hypothetical protein VNO30_34530 [Kofleriaceae bacterium]|nr:hypothetical protein [Kofleriaceae bacterium]